MHYYTYLIFFDKMWYFSFISEPIKGDHFYTLSRLKIKRSSLLALKTRHTRNNVKFIKKKRKNLVDLDGELICLCLVYFYRKLFNRSDVVFRKLIKRFVCLGSSILCYIIFCKRIHFVRANNERMLIIHEIRIWWRKHNRHGRSGILVFSKFRRQYIRWRAHTEYEEEKTKNTLPTAYRCVYVCRSNETVPCWELGNDSVGCRWPRRTQQAVCFTHALNRFRIFVFVPQ